MVCTYTYIGHLLSSLLIRLNKRIRQIHSICHCISFLWKRFRHNTVIHHAMVNFLWHISFGRKFYLFKPNSTDQSNFSSFPFAIALAIFNAFMHGEDKGSIWNLYFWCCFFCVPFRFSFIWSHFEQCVFANTKSTIYGHAKIPLNALRLEEHYNRPARRGYAYWIANTLEPNTNSFLNKYHFINKRFDARVALRCAKAQKETNGVRKRIEKTTATAATIETRDRTS